MRGSRDPEKELQSLQRRFAAISDRHDRALRKRNFLRGLRTATIASGLPVFCAVFVGLMASPFDPVDSVRHLAAFPRCAMADAVGLAPSRRGQPGYWPHLDRDEDGVACEIWGDRLRGGR